MLSEAYGARISMESAHEIAAYITNSAKEGVKVKPEELEPADAGNASGDSAAQSTSWSSSNSLDKGYASYKNHCCF